ncbi:TRAP transporter substrate-binding protein DctP [Alcanivorax xiamenensis]|nr:TRAP transporter substrate-binding protein DctP [Alcanivorax xiamenensis]
MTPFARALCVLSILSLWCLSPSVQAEPRTLHYATAVAPTDRPNNQARRWWAEQIKARTNGEIEIEIHWMQSLVKYPDTAQAVSSGLADIAGMTPDYTAARFPLWALSQTEVGPGDHYISAEAWRRMMANTPALQEELRRNNMAFMSVYSTGPRVLISNTRPYLTPADFEGDRVRLTPRSVQAAQRADWDVTPINLTFTDIYSAMDRGTLNGAQSAAYLVPLFKHHEVATHIVETGNGQSMILEAMNLDTWNSLTPKQQRVFSEVNRELEVRMAEAGLEELEQARKMIRNNREFPTEYHILDAEQQAQWEAGYLPVERAFAERTSKRSPQAASVFERFQERLKEVASEVREDGYPWERNEVADR